MFRLTHKKTRWPSFDCFTCGANWGLYSKLLLADDDGNRVRICIDCAEADPDAIAERALVRAAELTRQVEYLRRIAHELRSSPPLKWPTRRQLAAVEEAAGAASPF